MSKIHDPEVGRGRLEKRYAALLAEQESSGLSMVAFAAQAGVSSATLYTWRRRLRRKRSRPGLVEVSTIEAAATCEALTLRIGSEYAIEVRGGFDGETLRRVLEVLAGC